MSSKTKIVVLRMKEIIYTAIFIGLGILLIALFVIMFHPKKDAPASSDQAAPYVPGVYSASLSLGSQNVNVEVAVDADRINSITLVPLDEAVTTMYPLMQPTLDGLAQQIIDSQTLEGITYANETKYTSNALLKAIETALNKAKSR